MAVSDDDLPGTTRWPVDPDGGLDYCQWCAQLQQADGLAELSARVEAARRNDSVPLRRAWGGLWRGRGAPRGRPRLRLVPGRRGKHPWGTSL
ncbi:hypothetical protein ACOBQB_29955 [Streptomyces sp. G5(2025)]|uniref:hypothetical protein n=1 Tax=Streptomyces sp. G5(2025) TaxID=3406628 RepID=UPI003C214868